MPNSWMKSAAGGFEEKMCDNELMLIIPSKEMKEEILQYKEEHFKSGDMQVHGSGGLAYYDDFTDWLEHIDSIRKKKRIWHKTIETYSELCKTVRAARSNCSMRQR